MHANPKGPHPCGDPDPPFPFTFQPEIAVSRLAGHPQREVENDPSSHPYNRPRLTVPGDGTAV